MQYFYVLLPFTLFWFFFITCYYRYLLAHYAESSPVCDVILSKDKVPDEFLETFDEIIKTFSTIEKIKVVGMEKQAYIVEHVSVFVYNCKLQLKIFMVRPITIFVSTYIRYMLSGMSAV